MKGSASVPHLNFLQAATSHRAAGARAGGEGVVEALLAAAVMDEADVLAAVGSSLEGLDAADAEARLAASGLNLVGYDHPPGVLRELWARMKNPLNALLLALAAVSYAVGDVHAAIVIMAIVALAVAMAFVQEHRSNAAAAKLRALVKISASVKRRGEGQGTTGVFEEIASELLVPGDIVRLSAGDMVPADIRLLSTKELYLDQSTMTGEAMPCEKTATPCETAVTAALGAPNLGLTGASVTSGFATGVVLCTGAETYFGQLAEQIARHRQPTSFDEGVNRSSG